MPTEAPNTLRSRARYKIVDILSEGPIKGLVNGAQSIFLDDTPIQNRDGTYNFPNFDVTRDVTELPVVAPTGSNAPLFHGTFPASENTVNVGVKVTNDSPEGSGSGDGSVTRTITDSSLDAARVTLRIPALAITNTTTGDIAGGQINFNIYVKPNGGDFSPIDAGAAWTNLTVGGNTLPESSGVELTVRLSGDRTTAKKITWQYAEVVGGIVGEWITYASVDIPATSSSQQAEGFYNWSANLGDFTRSVKYLGAGTYRVRSVTTGGTGTDISARQYQVVGLQISGKTVSPYDVSYNVPLPDGGAPWEIKVQRWTSDNTAANYQDDLYWLSYTEIINNRFSWPNIAGMQLTFDAESFGGNVPARSYDVMGLMVQIPSNYDPYNRLYTGTWDGTFKTDWTDNPAWIFYDLLTNKRYGLGSNIDAAQIDKWALYSIGQYCDELVDAPNGKQEPRYTCSCVINSQQEAYDLLTAIASAFRGMIYWSNGAITATADMPSDPVIDVGPANVINGEFTYQGASRKARHTVARVSWNNPDDGYKLNVEIYEDTEAIRKYGYRPIDINAFGCTSRGLARRWGKWLISSDNDAPDTVTYKASFDHFAIRPGDVIRIADPNYSAEQNFGRIVSIVDNEDTTHTITLDRAVTLIGGDDSELALTLPDQTQLLLDVSVLVTATSSEITVPSASLTTMPMIGAVWLLKKETVEPRQWRVFSVVESEKNIYQVSAMLYNPNKYAEIETGLNFEEANFSAMPTGEIPAPTGLVVSEFLKQTGSAILECATLSWTRPDDARADFFEVQYQIDGRDWQATTPNLVGTTSVDILNIVPETYNFRVRAQDSTGLFRSSWATLSSQTLLGKQKKPENVTGFTATVEKFGILLKWTPVSDIDIDFYEIRSGASWAAGTVIGKPKAAEFKYEENVTGAYTFWIAAKDTSKNYSATPASASATISAQGTPTLSTVAVNGGIQLTIGGTVSRGFKNYEIQRKEYPSGAETTINNNVLTRIFTDSDIATLGYVKSWQYRVRAVDQNGSASAYTAWSAQLTPKQIENNDITANQIIAKDFRTACNAGNGTVSGVLFNANGIQAWNGATNTFCIDAATGNVSLTGTITANIGCIGGWCIATGCLYATNAKMYSGAANTARMEFGTGACSAGINSANAGTDISFWAGSTFANRASAPFRVTAAGAITATSGLIGGFTIDGTEGLYAGTGATRVQMKAGAGFWAGATAQNDACFSVTQAGYLKSTSGLIGAWTISQTRLCRLFTNGCLVLGMGQGEQIQWAENTDGAWSAITIGQCVWTGTYVARTGMAITFNNTPYFQVHKPIGGGAICANIAGWNFNATQIYSTGCGLILCNTGAIQTGSFVTGNAGWKIDYLGNAEFNNICARGAIRTAVFIKDEISVIGGRTLIRPAGVSTLDCNPGADTFNIHLGSNIDQFAVNDLIRIKDGAGDFWACVCACNGASQCLTVVKTAGTRFAFTKGQAIVNYGAKTGCGGILLDGQAPYIDIYTHNGTPWNGTCSRGRMGNLNGWGSFSTDTYGLALGSPTGNYMTYDSVSGNLNILGNINVCSTLPLSMPGGAVLDISAKGSTTDTIALTGGVKDVSGNGNNGTAYNGVTVSDSKIGKVFQFDGASKYINIPSLGSDAPWTVSAWVARNAFANATWKTIIAVASGNIHHLILTDDYGVGLWDGSHKSFGYVVPNDGKFHALTVIYHNSTSASLYADGVFVRTITINLNLNTYKFGKIGNWSGGGYHAGPIGNLKIYNRALTAEEVKTLYLVGNQQESGTITADRVQTGTLQSINWGTSAGSLFNLNDGTFAMGGSSAPKLCWNGTTLSVTGNITITGGSGIGNFSDAGALATVDNLDGVADGSTYKRTTTNEKTGAGRAYSGLDSSNRLVTAVIPGTAVTPSTAGLFIGSTNMGYHNGTVWKTYMDNCGNFYLGGSAVGGCGLAWNATSNCLTVCGCITSGAGRIGGWNITGSQIIQTCIGGVNNRKLEMNASYASIHWWQGDASSGAFLGQIHTTGWTGRYGLAVVQNSVSIFEASYDKSNNLTAQIAGWNFNAACLYKGNLILNSAGSISGNYNGDVSGWCIDAAGNAKFNNATVRGTVCATSGCIGRWTILDTTICSVNCGAMMLLSGYNGGRMYITAGDTAQCGSISIGNYLRYPGAFCTGYTGITILGKGESVLFRATMNSTTGENFCGILAGWNFNAACLYKGNLILNSNGAISGCYNGTTTGWCINAAGDAVFNNATVRGTVCASAGRIGCFILNSGNLFSRNCSANDCGHFDLFGGSGTPQLMICHRCLTTGCTTSQFSINSWYDGSTSDWAPLRVYSLGTYTAFFQKSVCIGVCGDSPLFDSATFRIKTGSGQSCGIWSNAYNGADASTAAMRIYMCCGTACYAFCTNGKINATGGYTCSSDRNMKTDIQDVNVLHLLRQMPVTKWRFKDSRDYRIGPMAQDFNNLFKLNHDWQTNLTVSGLDGIALKAVKEVDENVQEHDKCIVMLKEKLQKLECEMAAIREMIN